MSKMTCLTAKLTVGLAGLLASPLALLAWDVEHDEVAQLVGESLPPEIKAQFDFDDFGVLMGYCHFPDMTEWEPRRFRNLDDLEPLVGAEDRAIIAAQGFHGYWMHTEVGKATFMALMARAFGRCEHRKAAFYLSAISHPIGDESALNHPTILNFVQYCRYEGVDFGAKKVESGAKNVFGFRSDGGVVRRVREKLKGYRPSVPAGDFQAQQLELCVRAVDQASVAAEQEAAIAFGKGEDPVEALADLVAMQVRAIVDVAWTCWVNRSPAAPLPYADFKARFGREAKKAAARIDASRQGVFRDLFDATKNPASPKGSVAIVCEALALRSGGVQSYVGRLVLGACGRTLRKLGYAVCAYDYGKLRVGELDVARTPTLIVAAGQDDPGERMAAVLTAYRRAGGRLVYICGQNPTGAPRPGDSRDITGLGSLINARKSEELPVSPGWHRAGACPDWRKMAVEIGSCRYPLKRDANGDGYAKPICCFEISLPQGVCPPSDGVCPLAMVDNGTSRFCVAARQGKVVWLPVYLLSPFLFSDDTALDFGALTLDSFGEKVLKLVLASFD